MQSKDTNVELNAKNNSKGHVHSNNMHAEVWTEWLQYIRCTSIMFNFVCFK